MSLWDAFAGEAPAPQQLPVKFLVSENSHVHANSAKLDARAPGWRCFASVLAEHKQYDQRTRTVHFPKTDESTRLCREVEAYFQGAFTQGRLVLPSGRQSAAPTKQLHGGFDVQTVRQVEDRPEYPHTTLHSAGRDSSHNQAMNVLLLPLKGSASGDSDKNRLFNACPALQKLIALVKTHLQTGLGEAYQFEEVVGQYVRVADLGGFEEHTDTGDFYNDKKTLDIPVHATSVMLLSEDDKTTYVVGAKEEGALKGPGSVETFASEMYHRSGVLLYKGCVILTILYKLKVRASDERPHPPLDAG